MELNESTFEEYSMKCPYWKRYGKEHDCTDHENASRICEYEKCPAVKKTDVRYNVWKCVTCPSFCIFPYSEPYDNIHVCPHDERIRIDVRHEELFEIQLLRRFSKAE